MADRTVYGKTHSVASNSAAFLASFPAGGSLMASEAMGFWDESAVLDGIVPVLSPRPPVEVIRRVVGADVIPMTHDQLGFRSRTVECLADQDMHPVRLGLTISTERHGYVRTRTPGAEDTPRHSANPPLGVPARRRHNHKGVQPTNPTEIAYLVNLFVTANGNPVLQGGDLHG